MNSETSSTPSRPDLSVVIPLYNEQDVLPLLLDRLLPVCDSTELDVEVIFVDDGSLDETLKIVASSVRADGRVRGLILSRHFGHQAALGAGLREARGKRVLVMDGDLQDPPELIPMFIDKANEGYDVVYGIRRKRKEGLFFRLASYIFYRLLARLSSVPIQLDSGDFSLMSRRVVDIVNAMPENRKFLRGLRAYVGFSQAGLPFERGRRAAGRSKYGISRLIDLAREAIAGYSEAPFRSASVLGMSLTLLALLALPMIIIGVLPLPQKTSIVEGSLFATLGLVIGVQLLALGWLGNYLARVFRAVLHRPEAIVSRRLTRLNLDAQDDDNYLPPRMSTT